MSAPRRVVLLLASLALLPALAGPASAAEAAAFLTGASPADDWVRGVGGSFTIVLFNLVYGEGEIAWQPGEEADTGLATGSGKAYLGPSIGRFVPYAGLGVGIYHLASPSAGDNGTFGSLFLGAKLRAPLGIFARAEYQFLDLPTTVTPGLEHRLLVGAGIAF